MHRLYEFCNLFLGSVSVSVLVSIFLLFFNFSNLNHPFRTVLPVLYFPSLMKTAFASSNFSSSSSSLTRLATPSSASSFTYPPLFLSSNPATTTMKTNSKTKTNHSHSFPLARPFSMNVEPNPMHKPVYTCPSQGSSSLSQQPLFPHSDPAAMIVDPSKFASDPTENLKAFLKTRASLDPYETVVFWWTGEIYAVVPEQPSKHLFSFEGFNIARLAPVQGQGYRMLTREAGFYKKPGTDEILEWFHNDVTGNTDRVVHVWNDPVNQQFMLQGPQGPFKVPVTVAGNDVTFNAEIFLKYDNPLPKSEFPNISSSNLYEGAELFQFFTSMDNLRAQLPSAPCNISWVRISQYLPFMQMGARDGRLIYHCRGKKLPTGFDALPIHIKEYVRRQNPHFQYAPQEFYTPNETSWTYYKKLIENRWQPRADGTIAKPDMDPLPETNEFQPSTQRQFTKTQLANYDGSNPNRQILLAINGAVFDVTKGRKHYGLGQTYNCLVAKDSTRAFVTGDLKQKMDATRFLSLRNLNSDQNLTAYRWLEFFKKHYPQVGVCIGWDDDEFLHPQNKTSYDHHIHAKNVFEWTFEILSFA